MTTMTSITTHAGASVHTERYEALRSRALDPHHAVAAHEGCVVANPRHSYGYGCGLRLASQSASRTPRPEIVNTF